MKIIAVLNTKGVHVITVRPEQSVREAIALLVEHNVGALVVTDEAERPVGIVSERDIIRASARTPDVFNQPIRQVMTKDVIVASPHDDLKSVAQTMTERRFRHLPVMDQGRLAGIVSIGDVVKAQLEEYEGEIHTLQTQIMEGRA
ncbi:MAG TPA: CBS domain-containing protein [Anaerolineae bacterium]|nr:CBS domain-containing protein [Anaerolineae bacterium]